jgi:hypothetical protein
MTTWLPLPLHTALIDSWYSESSGKSPRLSVIPGCGSNVTSQE